MDGTTTAEILARVVDLCQGLRRSCACAAVLFRESARPVRQLLDAQAVLEADRDRRRTHALQIPAVGTDP